MSRQPIRRTARAGRCPACGGTQVSRETTVKGRTVAVSWKCTVCKKVWRDPRPKT